MQSPVRRFLLVLPLLLVGARAAVAQPLPPPPIPSGNPFSDAKANLGKVLFWDEQLSSTRTISCGTCHIPGAGGSDPLSDLPGALSLNPGKDGLPGTPDDVRGSPGVVLSTATGHYVKATPFELLRQVTGRKSPTVINAAYAPSLFWDGRADGSFEDPQTGATILPAKAALESQVAGPPLSDVEMGHMGRSWLDVSNGIANAKPLALATTVPPALKAWIAGRTYPQLFGEAFGLPFISPALIIQAIATYERTLISDQAPADIAAIPGNPPLPAQEKFGQDVFNGKGRCNLCHPAPHYTDQLFHNTGVRPIDEDLGQAGATGNNHHNGRFKTPTVRNAGLRPPFFHNGGAKTLLDVVEFYDRGGDFHVQQTIGIVPLNLTQAEKDALVVFMEKSLTDPRVAQELPPFDRPQLYSESTHVPPSYGAGAPGAGGLTPRWVALEPPFLGNPSLTLALADGLGGAPALIGLDVLPAPPGTSLNGLPFHLGGTPSLQLLSIKLLGSGAGDGWISFSAQIPDVPALDGLSIYLQAFVADVAATAGLSATAGLELKFYGLP